jgi:hypothetical protein
MIVVVLKVRGGCCDCGGFEGLLVWVIKLGMWAIGVGVWGTCAAGEPESTKKKYKKNYFIIF